MTKRTLKSIAIIPDGNRRFSRKRGISIAQAYARGFEKAREVIRWSGEGTSVPSVAFWALSLDNLAKRSSLEKRILFSQMKRNITQALKSGELREQGVAVRFFGKLAALPRDLRDALSRVENATADNAKRVVSVGLAYGGREEVFEAARSFALDLRNGVLKEKDLTPAAFEARLWFPETPDLVIRTGRVQRLSGFLPLQAGYSELYFSPKLWPEFTRDDYATAVQFFNESEARYGK
jgi:undecaprenyl diphosphate synthase